MAKICYQLSAPEPVPVKRNTVIFPPLGRIDSHHFRPESGEAKNNPENPVHPVENNRDSLFQCGPENVINCLHPCTKIER